MSRKIRCTIVDDETSNAQTLKDLLQKFPSIEIEEVFTNPMEFLRDLTKLQSLVFFLDIEMPGISGLELAEKLRGKTVVFVSGHKEYADQAFDLEVLDFVKKPIQETRLEATIQKINKKFNTLTDFAYFPTPTGDVRVKYDDIIYVTTSDIDSRDKDLYLTTREKPLTVKTKNLDHILNLLNPELFLIINKHCLVNLKHVISKSKQRQIELSAPLNGKSIHEEVSEKYWKEFQLKCGMT